MAEPKQQPHPIPGGKRVNQLVWPVAVIGLVAAAIYGYNRWQDDRTHIATDNAQVQGKLVKILAPERGFLDQVTVKENQIVESGQLLANLENRYFQLQVNRAQANLNALLARKGSESSKSDSGGLAEAKLASAKANLEVVQAQLEEAKSSADQANAQLQRMQDNQLSQSFVQSQLDMAQANARQANARYLTLQKEAFAAQQQVQEASANAQLLDFNIEQAKAELAQAKLSLDYTEIKSPINGTVAQTAVYPGVMVEAGQYLMTIVSRDDKWIVANIKETEFERVRPGDFVDITVDAFPGTTFRGVVQSLSPAAGNQFSIIPRNNASGNFIKVEALIPVEIHLIEPVDIIDELVPGMSAEVRIEVEPPAPVKLHPATASGNKPGTPAPDESAPPAKDPPAKDTSPTPAAKASDAQPAQSN